MYVPEFDPRSTAILNGALDVLRILDPAAEQRVETDLIDPARIRDDAGQIMHAARIALVDLGNLDSSRRLISLSIFNNPPEDKPHQALFGMIIDHGRDVDGTRLARVTSTGIITAAERPDDLPSASFYKPASDYLKDEFEGDILFSLRYDLEVLLRGYDEGDPDSYEMIRDGLKNRQATIPGVAHMGRLILSNS